MLVLFDSCTSPLIPTTFDFLFGHLAAQVLLNLLLFFFLKLFHHFVILFRDKELFHVDFILAFLDKLFVGGVEFTQILSVELNLSGQVWSRLRGALACFDFLFLFLSMLFFGLFLVDEVQKRLLVLIIAIFVRSVTHFGGGVVIAAGFIVVLFLLLILDRIFLLLLINLFGSLQHLFRIDLYLRLVYLATELGGGFAKEAGRGGAEKTTGR